MQRDESDQESLDFDGLEALEPLDSPSRVGWSGPSFQQPRAEGLPDPGSDFPARGRATPAGLRPSSGNLVSKRSLERQRSLPAELEGSGSGGSQKAKERNKKAQRTFRERQKAKAQQQGESLEQAAARVAELEEHVANLQIVISAGSASAEGVSQEAEGTLLDRIQAGSSALQLEKSRLVVREHKLLHALQAHQQGQESGPSSSTSRVPSVDPIGLARSTVLATREGHLRSIKPTAAWDECTPVRMSELYINILEGRLEMQLPLANGQAPERPITLGRLIAMPIQQHMQLQAQYHACLASAAPFCGDPNSAHSKHFQSVMGEAMVLLAVFSECLPNQFLSSQGVNMLDGTTRMPPEAFEEVKAVARAIVLDPGQLAAGRALVAEYNSLATRVRAEREQLLAAMQPGASVAAARGPAAAPAAAMVAARHPELSTPHQAAAIMSGMDRLTHSFDLQQEAYLHLVRSLILCILTPYQTALLCATAFPYLCEFPCILAEMLSPGGSST